MKTLHILEIAAVALLVLSAAGFVIVTSHEAKASQEAHARSCHVESNDMGYQRTVCSDGTKTPWGSP